MLRSTTISVLLLVSLIDVSLGLKCYQCGTATWSSNKNCLDENLGSRYEPRPCPTNITYCAKATVNGIILRGCALACVEQENFICCDSDGCNGSTAGSTGNMGGGDGQGNTDEGDGQGNTDGGDGQGNMGGGDGQGNTGGCDGNGNGSTATAVNVFGLVVTLFAGAVFTKAQ